METMKYIAGMLLAMILVAGPADVSAQDEKERQKSEQLEWEKEIKKAMDPEKWEKAMDEFKIQHAEQIKQAERMAREMEFRARAMTFGDQNSSQLMLSKNFNGNDSDNKGVFQVEESVKNIRLNIDGSVTSGSIKISLVLPGGEVFKELTIDDSADVRYTQSLSLNENGERYKGSWTYRIKAVKAEGSYRISINTN